jgi:hypothetical protein
VRLAQSARRNEAHRLRDIVMPTKAGTHVLRGLGAVVADDRTHDVIGEHPNRQDANLPPAAHRVVGHIHQRLPNGTGGKYLQRMLGIAGEQGGATDRRPNGVVALHQQ